MTEIKVAVLEEIWNFLVQTFYLNLFSVSNIHYHIHASFREYKEMYEPLIHEVTLRRNGKKATTSPWGYEFDFPRLYIGVFCAK